MADDRKRRGGQDRNHVNVNEDCEPCDRAARLGVPPGVIRQAVNDGGDSAEKVEWHVRQNQASA